MQISSEYCVLPNDENLKYHSLMQNKFIPKNLLQFNRYNVFYLSYFLFYDLETSKFLLKINKNSQIECNSNALNIMHE